MFIDITNRLVSSYYNVCYTYYTIYESWIYMYSHRQNSWSNSSENPDPTDQKNPDQFMNLGHVKKHKISEVSIFIIAQL